MDTTARCPQCQAAAPQGATWCSLCFADLRADAGVPPGTSVDPSVAAPETWAATSSATSTGGAADADADADAAAGSDVDSDADPDSAADSGATPESRAAAERRAEQMLAQLAGQTPRLGLPGPFATAGGRVAVMLGGVVVLSGLTLGVLQGAGALLP